MVNKIATYFDSQSVVGVEKMVGSQPPPACCHVNHMINTLYRACSRGALGEQSIHSDIPYLIFQQLGAPKVYTNVVYDD